MRPTTNLFNDSKFQALRGSSKLLNCLSLRKIVIVSSIHPLAGRHATEAIIERLLCIEVSHACNLFKRCNARIAIHRSVDPRSQVSVQGTKWLLYRLLRVPYRLIDRSVWGGVLPIPTLQAIDAQWQAVLQRSPNRALNVRLVAVAVPVAWFLFCFCHDKSSEFKSLENLLWNCLSTYQSWIDEIARNAMDSSCDETCHHVTEIDSNFRIWTRLNCRPHRRQRYANVKLCWVICSDGASDSEHRLMTSFPDGWQSASRAILFSSCAESPERISCILFPGNYSHSTNFSQRVGSCHDAISGGSRGLSTLRIIVTVGNAR